MSNTRNIKMVIQYDGKRYQGWQSQKHTDQTIQCKIETLLSKVLEESIEITGSGRTDSGVHAYGQVANFHTNSTMPLEELQQAFWQYLPQDINVLSLEEVDERFHARLSAKAKTYQYSIYNAPVIDVFARNYAWNIQEPLDVEAMKKAASLLCGEHDFMSFCSNKKMKKSTVRTIYSIDFDVIPVPYGNQIEINYRGNGFLYNMVRILTGTLVEVGLGKRLPEDIPAIIKAENRQAAGVTAPPMGLFLCNVEYDDTNKCIE